MNRPPNTVSRRTMLKTFALSAAALGAGCTPVRFLLRTTSADLAEDPRRIDEVLKGFVDAVVPGCDPDHAGAIRALGDPRLPFARYRSLLASDLCKRAGELCGSRHFEQLPRLERTKVIADGLSADRLTQKLYTGAVFLTQVALLAGIYDDQAGAPLMNFDGAYQFRGLAAVSYPNPERFLPSALTATGNYH